MSLLNKIRVLGFDPGPKNFGCFGGEILLKESMPLLRVNESKMLVNTLNDLTGSLDKTIQPFMDEMSGYIEYHRPHLIVIERFMTRGHKGTTIEYVCVMMGALSALVNSYQEQGMSIRIMTPTAAGWKNRINKIIDLKTMYKVMKRYKIPDHQVDASLMPLIALRNKYDNPYVFLADKRKRDKYIKSMIDTAT